MATVEVGIRELKTRLGLYMKRVQAGTTIIVTDRGRPVGRIIPVKASQDARIQELMEAGFLHWSGKKLKRRVPVIRPKGGVNVADLLIEDRE